jgi:hypothetical protein
MTPIYNPGRGFRNQASVDVQYGDYPSDLDDQELPESITMSPILEQYISGRGVNQSLPDGAEPMDDDVEVIANTGISTGEGYSTGVAAVAAQESLQAAVGVSHTFETARGFGADAGAADRTTADDSDADESPPSPPLATDPASRATWDGTSWRKMPTTTLV